jgi:dTDP-3-amino-2,3,6-trideoxy-4-keto-D-glucose/dTDP-3-amino-3,4,6-trideoxy-alpha-D-glucose/dTDP-2,6-dideoxy-D-kanosamine transaminase
MIERLPVFDIVHDPDLDAALRDVAARVISKRRYVLDEEVAAFEREFAEFCGTLHCVGVGNGTDALEIALRAAGVSRGDRVATVANAGYYSCTALDAIGAEPVFIDVDQTLTMSPALLKRALPQLDAVVVTHLYGRLAAIESIVALARHRAIPVIEDCAHAHGAARHGQRAGTFGAAGCFSFYPTKNLGALGDAGAIVTSDGEIAARARALRQYGWSSRYRTENAGGRNSRLDELQAAFLRVKLPRLSAVNAARTAIAHRYREGLRDLGVTLPERDEEDFVAHLVVIRVADRDAFRARLAQEGIETSVHYPIADYHQPVRASKPQAPLTTTEAACREVVTLPCFPGLPIEAVDHVVRAVRRHYRPASTVAG